MSFKLISMGESYPFVREVGFAGLMSGRKMCREEGAPDRHLTESAHRMQDFETPMAKDPYVIVYGGS